MSDERFLVTGAMGCIGTWVVRNLIMEGTPTTVLDLSDQPKRMRLIMSDEEIDQVAFIKGDITDTDLVRRVVAKSGVTHIVHLAALQVPFCKADPPGGARVNVVGTINVFEAARAAGIRHIAFASSSAVYGMAEEYSDGPISDDALLNPHTLYGVYKRANEGSARVYWWDHGISSIGIRPYVVYGPGRDQGMTSTPTKAMLAATLGQPYRISYGGHFNMQFVDDVARTFIQAARASFAGATTLNLRGDATHMQKVIDAICLARPDMTDKLSYEETALPFPSDLDDAALTKLLGPLPYTPLNDGVKQTIDMFENAITNGLLGMADIA